MTHIIVDLEATCCNQGSVPKNEMEIIEIGAVAIDSLSYDVIDEYDAIVRPVRHPELTPFCTELTSITQSMVDQGCDFSAALSGFVAFMAEHGAEHFCCWGDYDFRQFQQDCDYHGIGFPFRPHVNIKKLFAGNFGLRKPCGLGKAIRLAGLGFSGTAHRGIDDVRNMARLADYIWGKRRLC